MEPPHCTEPRVGVVLENQQPTPQATAYEEVHTVADFVTQYKQFLPLRVKVIEGFCGKEER